MRHTTKVLTSDHTRQLVPPTLVGDSFVVPPYCAARRWTRHENHSSKDLHPPGLEVVPLGGEGRGHLAYGRQGGPRVRFPTTSSGLKTLFFFKLEILSQDRPSNEREDPQRTQVARVVAHEPARSSPREERSSGRRPRGAASSKARLDRNLLPREPSLEPAKVPPALASEAPVHPAPLCLQRCCPAVENQCVRIKRA